MRALGLDTECLGGGRIEHFPESKLLKVYGHSTVSITRGNKIIIPVDNTKRNLKEKLNECFFVFLLKQN